MLQYYFTTWVLAAVLVPGIDQVLDLSILTGIMFLGSCYLTFVHPRMYRLFDGSIATGGRRFLVDAPLHWMPLLYVLLATDLAQREVTLSGLAGTALFLAAYVVAVGPSYISWLYML